jgi:hypothetical protein
MCFYEAKFPLPNSFRFENYWIKMEDFQSLVHNAWFEKKIAVTPKQLHVKLTVLRQRIIFLEKREDR